jgi:hypothetical protein
MGIVPFGEAMGWWRVPLDASPAYLALLFVGATVSTAPIYLVTWRIARRFGWRGLAVTFAVAALGPLREFAVEATFPAWVTIAPGVATVLVISAGYVVAFAGGHWVMYLVAGTSRGSPLARWPWQAAERGAAPNHAAR